jgi:hypothetical protein
MKTPDASSAFIVDSLDLRAAMGLPFGMQEYLTLRNCGLSGTLRIFSDPLERPVGYIAWANVSRATVDRLHRSRKAPKYPAEWNEGRICLVLDVLLLPNGKYEARRQLRGFLRRKRAIAFAGRGKGLRLYLRTSHGFIRRRAVVRGITRSGGPASRSI